MNGGSEPVGDGVWTLIVISIVLFSILIPGCILIGREHIRAYRKDIVKDLQVLFDFARTADGEPIIIPSFELVRYKYAPSDSEVRGHTTKSEGWSYFISMLIFASTSTMGMLLAFWDNLGMDSPFNFSEWQSIFFLASNYFGATPSANSLNQLLSVIAFAFLGAYIFAITYLIRRVANFDLSPLSFFRASIHILVACVVAATLYHGAQLVSPGKISNIQLPIAFLIGLFPDLGLQYLTSRFPALRLKGVPRQAKDIAFELPLDVISGIDPYIKFRLEEFEIGDVQNLATANPIQIFVETPYGLYEAIDWVAQAQLIIGMGIDKIARINDMGIRTIFDLERVLTSPLLRRKFIHIFFDELSPDELKAAASQPLPEKIRTHLEGLQKTSKSRGEAFEEICASAAVTEDPVLAIVGGLYDDLHVRRLRQIWDVISERLADRAEPRPALPATVVTAFAKQP